MNEAKPQSSLVLGGVSNALPERIAPCVVNLTPPAHAVIEHWNAKTKNERLLARNSDSNMASAVSEDQWYLRAVRLRADWRISAVRDGAPNTLAAEALEIIDGAIALHEDLDSYGMRTAAAYLVDDYKAVVQTARRLVWLIRSDVEFRLRSGIGSLAPGELARTKLRLQSIQARLQQVRESGRVDPYKLGDLDEQIAALQEQIEGIGQPDQ